VNTTLDHLVVAAASLEQGVHWCERVLGVTPGPGGRHARMGTHNRLLRLSTEAFPDCYLEIIAIDPEAPAPARPRWFGLDDPALREALADGPRLVHAVARSPQLDVHRQHLIVCGVQPGEAMEMSRASAAGELRWQILVRPDGALSFGGALPTLIQWHCPHPAAAMPASGITLRSLSLGGLPVRVREALRMPQVEMADASVPALQAGFDTPLGSLTLTSNP
jgi:hypothetical protein